MKDMKESTKRGKVNGTAPKTTVPGRRAKARIYRKAVLFNVAEMEAINRFCKKYKITNQAKFFRETIVSAILRKTEEDHPKLF